MRLRVRPGRPVSCEEFAGGVVTDYMEQALAASRRDAVERHLVHCPGCARLLAELQLTVELLGLFGRGEPAAAAR